MDRTPFDPAFPYEMLTDDDARRLLRRSGMAKHEVNRLSLPELHDAIVERRAGGKRDMAAVVIVTQRTASRIAEESIRMLGELRPDLPRPYKGAAASVSGARQTLGGLPEDMPIEKIERAVHAMFHQDVAVLTDENFARLNRALNAILGKVPHGRSAATTDAIDA